MKHKKQKLFCPGPVNTAENVKAAIFHEIGHREKEFSRVLTKLNQKILELFVTKNSKKYHPVFVTGSGTAANEAVFSSIANGQKILIVSNGEFGERLYEISSLHNKNARLLRFEWGETINLRLLEKTLAAQKPKFLAVVHHETSTGMLNPIEKIGQIAKKFSSTFIVDAVSSLGAERIDLDKSNIAFLTSSAGKALASLPGIGIIVGIHDEFRKLKNVKPKTVYLNLYKLYVYSTTLTQTPNTPAVQLFCALEQAITNIVKEGPGSRRDYVRALAEQLRAGLKKLNFEFLIDETQTCSVLTTVKIPEFITFNELRHKLLKENIVVYNGKGHLQNKFFQIANIGNLKPKDIELLLEKLSAVCNPLARNYTDLKTILLPATNIASGTPSKPLEIN